jgi:hypothetical protein
MLGRLRVFYTRKRRKRRALHEAVEELRIQILELNAILIIQSNSLVRKQKKRES